MLDLTYPIIVSPYSRGGADAYYGRPPRPHYEICTKENPLGKKITEENMTKEQISEYLKGFAEEPDRKDWG
jgi:hypothetical protein